MKFNLLVTGGLYDSQASVTALRFCQAALEAGHEITQVFFYQAGALTGNELAVPLSDEFDAVIEWSKLAEAYQLSLVVCVSAGERRGVISSEQKAELNKEVANLNSSFQIAGLASFFSASLNADRTVSFK